MLASRGIRRSALVAKSPRSKGPWGLSQQCTSSSTESSAPPTSAPHGDVLRAPFQKATHPGRLFPWRHEEKPLDRFIPGTPDYLEKRDLLGGNVVSSNNQLDALATAFFFLGVPWYKMPFFRHWKADLAESMSWAFAQAMSGMLSNVYHVPLGSISPDNHEYRLDFTYPLKEDRSKDFQQFDDVDLMMESRLRMLYESAHASGKDQIQIRLQTKPISSQIVSLFCFPFLSRRLVQKSSTFKVRYLEFLESMATSPRNAFPIYEELLEEYAQDGKMPDSTVICQVMVLCDESFWVKDLASGMTIQGFEDGLERKVWHLVRMEMVVEMQRSKGFLPVSLAQGNWQITDIDDMLDGNLII